MKNEQERAEQFLRDLGEKISHHSADLTGMAYAQLYGALQQLHMQGEYTVVERICSELIVLLD